MQQAKTPETFTPDELFIKLQEQPRPSKPVDFPRYDASGRPIGQLAMCPLTQEELIIAKAAATRHGKELTKDSLDPKEFLVGHQQVYEELCASEILFQACRQVADPRVRVFPSSQDVRKKLTTDETAILIQSYGIVQSELGPIVALMSEVEMNAWLERLASGANALPLGLISSEALRALVMHSARRLYPSPTENGSSGEPAEGDTSTESEPEKPPSAIAPA